ncbi:MAG: NUDIX hydrolase [Candidatus Micrarchaeia archaeon]
MPKKCIVAGCIIERGGKVLLIKHKKLHVWLYPGGHVEPGELPHEAAIREAKEETGIGVRLRTCAGHGSAAIKSKEAKELPLPFVILLERVQYAACVHMHFDMVYAASMASGAISLNKKEATDIGWFSRSEIEKLRTFDNVKQVLARFFSECARNPHQGHK